MAKQMTIVRKIQDKVLVTQSKAGKGLSYAKIFDKYYDDIYRFISFKISPPETAEDLAAEVFTRVWKYIHERQQTVDNCRALLYRVARNMIIDYYRKAPVKPLDDKVVDQLADKSPGIEEQTERKLQLELVQQALTHLPPEQQQLIVLRYMQELSFQEIAKITGIRKGTLRVVTHRALCKLRQHVTF